MSLCLQQSRLGVVLLIGGDMFGKSACLSTALLLSWCKSSSGFLILHGYGFRTWFETKSVCL